MKQGPNGNLTLEDFVKLAESVVEDSKPEMKEEDVIEFESDRVGLTKDGEAKMKLRSSSTRQQTIEKSTKKTSSPPTKSPKLQNHSKPRPSQVRPKRSQFKNMEIDSGTGKSTS